MKATLPEQDEEEDAVEDAEEESEEAVDSWLLPVPVLSPKPELPKETLDNRLNLSSGITGGGMLLRILTRRKLPRRILERAGLDTLPRARSIDELCVKVSVCVDCDEGATVTAAPAIDKKQQTNSLLGYFPCRRKWVS